MAKKPFIVWLKCDRCGIKTPQKECDDPLEHGIKVPFCRDNEYTIFSHPVDLVEDLVSVLVSEIKRA